MSKRTYRIIIEKVTGFTFVRISLLILLFTSCATNRNSSSTERENLLDEMTDLVESREFEIENDWALPLGGGNINLIGNPNYIHFKKDSVNLFLPYFGVRHAGGGYNRNTGISYEGPLNELEITESDDRSKIRIRFEGNQDTENLNFAITVYPNGNASTSVISSQRNTISYRGEIDELPEKFKEEEN